MRLIMLSPPGAGKGTHCTWLTQETGIPHISSGHLLRSEVTRETPLGRAFAEYTRRGDLVPDDLIFDIVTPVILAACRERGGYLLDGFPRTIPQALRLERMSLEVDLSCDACVYLAAPDDVLVERLVERARREGRTDDRAEVIRHRLVVFAQETASLVQFYRRRGILLEVDASRPVAEIRTDLRQVLTARGLLQAGPLSTATEQTGAPTKTAETK
jgi:adenylate kinase